MVDASTIEPTRWVVVDDKDDRIHYSEDWQSMGGGGYNSRGNFGETYRNSLHATGTDGADLYFSFRGNAARIKGVNDFEIDPTTGVTNPDWQCILDSKVVERQAILAPGPGNNWALCEFGDLVAADHNIRLKVMTTNRTFWFDYIEYRPTDAVDNEVVRATRADADLVYEGSGWEPLANTAFSTLTKGSNATFTFVGTGVSFYGMYSKELSHANGQATYTVDGGPSTTFIIPGGGDTSMFNRKILEVNGLSKQPHTVVLTYASDGGSTPLTISHLLIEGGTNLRAPASGSSGSPASKPPIGAIVGGALGGVAAVLMLLFFVWYWRRQRTRLRDNLNGVQPFNLTDEVRGGVSVQGPAARSKHSATTGNISSNPGSTISSLPSIPSRAVIHEDSGVRIPNEGTEAVVELPPVYTVS